jgi:hypothetical protein
MAYLPSKHGDIDIATAAREIRGKRQQRHERTRLARGALPIVCLGIVVGYLAQRGLPTKGASPEFYVAAATVVPLLALALLIDMRVFNAFEAADATRKWQETMFRGVESGAFIILPLAYIEICLLRILTYPAAKLEHEDPRVPVAVIAGGIAAVIGTAALMAFRTAREEHGKAVERARVTEPASHSSS